VRGVLDATNSSDRTDDDRERWQRFQRHVFCVFLFRVLLQTNNIFEENRHRKKEKEKEKEKEKRRTFVCVAS
jgi:hypothetical protein